MSGGHSEVGKRELKDLNGLFEDLVGVQIILLLVRLTGDTSVPLSKWQLTWSPKEPAKEYQISSYNLHCILTSIGKKKGTVNFRTIMDSNLAPVKTQTTSGFPSLLVISVKWQMTQAMHYCSW